MKVMRGELAGKEADRQSLLNSLEHAYDEKVSPSPAVVLPLLNLL